MIPNIKIYLCAATVISLLTVAGLSRLEVYYLTQEYNKYKENINDQVQQAKIEKARIEAEQTAKYDAARADFLDANRKLRDALDRLRKPTSVLRDAGLHVAGSGASSLSRTPEDTDSTTKAFEVDACIKQSSFFSAAMMDTLQCSRLIEFVK
jgi:hypothetical protein